MRANLPVDLAEADGLGLEQLLEDDTDNKDKVRSMIRHAKAHEHAPVLALLAGGDTDAIGLQSLSSQGHSVSSALNET